MNAAAVMRCDMCGHIGHENAIVGCPVCQWDEMRPIDAAPAPGRIPEPCIAPEVDLGGPTVFQQRIALTGCVVSMCTSAWGVYELFWAAAAVFSK